MVEINGEIVRPDPQVIDAFREHSAADVHESMDKQGSLGPEITRVTGDRTLCGPATTVRLPAGDNMMIHVGARLANPGDVLVIAADTTRAATWGELATRNALRKGLEGVVSAGNVRDVEEIDELGFPVFARSVSQTGAVKQTPGSVNVPVPVGDQVINPGDIVLGDANGVTIIPRERAEETLEAAEKHRQYENDIRDRIEDGESLYDIAGFDELLAEHGISIDSTQD